jgi:hypothetical protein
MSQTERKPDLPELPHGLNRMLMTSPRLLPYRPSLVRYLTLGVGTALAAAGLIIGGGLGVLPALGLMAASALALNTVATLCDLKLRKSLYANNKEPASASPSPFLEFAITLGRQFITPQTSVIELHQNTKVGCYRIMLLRDGHAVIEMNPNYVEGLHQDLIMSDILRATLGRSRWLGGNLAVSDGVSPSTARFAEMHAFALQHEIQHRQQPSWQDTYGKSLFLTSIVGLTPTALTFLLAAPSLTQIFATALAPVGIHALDLIRRRQNELDADSAAVRQLGSAAAARHLFGNKEKEKRVLTHPSSALRISAAELQESRLTEAERRGARAAFNALYKTTIAEFPELGGQRHPTGSPSSVRQNIPELA